MLLFPTLVVGFFHVGGISLELNSFLLIHIEKGTMVDQIYGLEWETRQVLSFPFLPLSIWWPPRARFSSAFVWASLSWFTGTSKQVNKSVWFPGLIFGNLIAFRFKVHSSISLLSNKGDIFILNILTHLFFTLFQTYMGKGGRVYWMHFQTITSIALVKTQKEL